MRILTSSGNFTECGLKGRWLCMFLSKFQIHVTGLSLIYEVGGDVQKVAGESSNCGMQVMYMKLII